MDNASKNADSVQVHAGHRARQRQRFLESGDFRGFADHNVLEMLLFYSIPRRDTNELAHALINRFGSLQRVFEASYEDLLKVDGISENSACLIKMVLPLYRRYAENCFKEKKTFADRNEIIEYLKSLYAGMAHEEVNMMCFDLKMKFISQTVLGIG
ncbi:MAG: DNA repair protein RadC, partial [Clostridia bacterium]|nr:DNA repair protein RadC [Clostridia bacterium]